MALATALSAIRSVAHSEAGSSRILAPLLGLRYLSTGSVNGVPVEVRSNIGADAF